MEVTTQLTKEDYFYFNKYSFRKQSRMRLVIFCILAAVMCFINFERDVLLLVNLINVFFTLVIFGLAWVGINWLNNFGFRKTIRHNPLIFEKRIVTLTDDGVKDRSQLGNGKVNWEAVKSVEEAGGLILIYLGKNFAIIVPKRDFDKESDSRSFVSFIKAKIHQTIS
jgi:hypothetical protein